MPSYYNTSPAGTRAVLQISTGTTAIASTTTGYQVPAVQNITVNNNVGIFNWTQLDTFSQFSLPTPASNSIAANLVVDSSTYFVSTVGSSGVPGLNDLSNGATLVQFRVYFDGVRTGARYVSGQGYITALAPTVNPTAPVWVTPVTIAVDGPLTAAAV
jgi:hypothetical protein